MNQKQDGSCNLKVHLLLAEHLDHLNHFILSFYQAFPQTVRAKQVVDEEK
jgi:hypothetical protein